MALVSISEAARLTGKSRRTLQRHIESGKLTKTYKNSIPKIDTSELLRVYGEFIVTADSNMSHESISHNTASNDTLVSQNKIELLQQEISYLNKLIDEKEKRNDDLKKAMLLLEDKTKEKPPVQKKWWQWFK